MADPLGITWLLEIDPDGDDSWTDISGYVEGEGIQLTVSVRENAASELMVTLHNRDGAFHPYYAAGSYFGYAGEEGVPCRLRMTYDSTTYTVWRGHIMDWDWQWPGKDRATLIIRGGDLMALIGGQEVDVDPADGDGTDDAFAAVMEAAGLTSSQYDKGPQPGQAIAFVPVDSNQTGPDVVKPTVNSLVARLLAAEMGGATYCDRVTGKPSFRNRAHYLGISSPTSWGDGTDIKPRVVQASRPRGQLITKTKTTQTKYTFGDEADDEEVVVYDAGYTAGNGLTLAAGQVVGPFRLVPNQLGVAGIYGVPKCVADVDYYADSLAAGGGTPKSVQVNIVLTPVPGLNYVYDMTIRNLDSSQVYLLRLQVRSVPIKSTSGDVLNAVGKGSPTGANDNSVGTTPWTNPTNISGTDNVYATAAVSASGTTQFLTAKSFGFSLPTTATVVGIVVQVEGKTSSADEEISARIIRGGIIEADETKTLTLTTTEGVHEVGGGFDLWSQEFEPSDINASDFGVAIWVDSAANSHTISIDNVRIVVGYVNYTGARSEQTTYVRELVIPSNATRRTWQYTVPWVTDDNLIRDFGEQELRKGRWPHGEVSLAFDWKNEATIEEMAQLDYGDLKQITLESGGAGQPNLDDWYRVVDYTHNITIGAAPWTMVNVRPADRWRNLDLIRWDDFTRDDGDLDGDETPTGDTWTVEAGSWAISSNAAVPGTTGSCVVMFDVGAEDMVIEISLANLSSDTNENCGLIFRGENGSNYWYFYVNDLNNSWNLVVNVAGNPVAVDSGSWTPTDTASLRVIARASRARGWVDRKQVFDISSATPGGTDTLAGFFASATTTVQFDNIYAEGLEA